MGVYFFSYGHVSLTFLKEKFGRVHLVGAGLLKDHDVRFVAGAPPSIMAEVPVLIPSPGSNIVGIVVKLEAYEVQLLDVLFGLTHTDVTVDMTRSSRRHVKPRTVVTHMPAVMRETVAPSAEAESKVRSVLLNAVTLYRRHLGLPSIDLVDCHP
jgi:hypothetical protein